MPIAAIGAMNRSAETHPPVDAREKDEKVWEKRNDEVSARAIGKWCAERKVLVTGDHRSGGAEAAKLSTLEMNICRVFPFGMINCDNNAFISAKILKWIVLHNKICGKRKHCCRAANEDGFGERQALSHRVSQALNVALIS